MVVCAQQSLMFCDVGRIRTIGDPMDRNDLLHDLTLMLMYLTSWEEKGLDGPVRRTWKSYDWDTIDHMDEAGLISTSHRSKSAYLSDEACQQAEFLVRVFGAFEDGLVRDLLAMKKKQKDGIRAFKFRIELDLWPEHPCWREVIVPADMPFALLHEVIQASFLWWDYHWSHFELRTHGETVRIMDAEQIRSFEEDPFGSPGVPLLDSAEVLLSDVFPRTRTARYDYDYGDGWEHKVTLVEKIDRYQGAWPVCTAGAGDAPPEDVGGPGGFRHFLEVLADPDDPDHEDMKAWGWSQFYEPFSLDAVNERIRAWGTGELLEAWDERNG